MSVSHLNSLSRLYVSAAIASAGLIAIGGVLWSGASLGARSGARPGTPGVPYANMPAIAPIGVRVDKYLDVPDLAKGASVDPAKGYRTEKLGDGLYMVTDGGYQSMFMTYEQGVVVIDAPPSYAAHIREAIAAVTDNPVTHVVYSHVHVDHIGGVNSLGGHPVIIAQAETNRLLARDKIRIDRSPPSRSRISFGCRSEVRCSSCPITVTPTCQETSSSTLRSSGP